MATTTDDKPVSLKALDAIRRCAETDMRRTFEGDAPAPDSKRAKLEAADDDEPADAAAPAGDEKAAFHEVARFAYAAVDRLYGGSGARGEAAGDVGGSGGGPPTAPAAAAPLLAFLVSSDMRHDKSGIREAERLLGLERLAPVKLACRGVALLLAPPRRRGENGEQEAEAKEEAKEEEEDEEDDERSAGVASLAAAERVLAALDAGGERPHFCLRIQPVGATCSATDPAAVAEAARRVCEAYRRHIGSAAAEGAAAAAAGGGGGGAGAGGGAAGGGGIKFAVVYKARHEGTSKVGSLRAPVIKAVAAAMERAYARGGGGGGGGGGGDGDGGGGGGAGAGAGSAASADLRNPDVVVFADLLPVAARPREPLLCLAAVPARACSQGGKIHFRGLAAAAGGGRGGGAGAGNKREAAAAERPDSKDAPPAALPV